jgi:hypothetical protein
LLNFIDLRFHDWYLEPIVFVEGNPGTTNPLRIVVAAVVVTEASDGWYVILMGCHQYPDESHMFFTSDTPKWLSE